jgi:hypothetical protein
MTGISVLRLREQGPVRQSVLAATRQRLLTRIFGALDDTDRTTLLRLLGQLDEAAQQLNCATHASHLGE